MLPVADSGDDFHGLVLFVRGFEKGFKEDVDGEGQRQGFVAEPLVDPGAAFVEFGVKVAEAGLVSGQQGHGLGLVQADFGVVGQGGREFERHAEFGVV